MNLRFPEIFGICLIGATVCSFGLPVSRSAPIENTFQFIFAPITGPIQWMTRSAEPPPRSDEPLLPEISDDVTRLREEKSLLKIEIARLNGQLETLRYLAAKNERIGEAIRDSVVPVKLIGLDGSGRDVVRLTGSSSSLVIEAGAPVITEKRVIGRVTAVGAGNQCSARLITDKGFKVLARFGRFSRQSDGSVRLDLLSLPETLVEGIGKSEMRIESLKTADVERAGLKLGDLVLLSDERNTEWPIEVHGYHLGVISYVGARNDTTGVAEVRVRPDVKIEQLNDVWIIGKPPVVTP